MGLEMSRSTWGPQQGIFPTPREVSSAVMRQKLHGRAQGSRETAVTNPAAVGAPTGHRCSTCVPKLLQGSSGMAPRPAVPSAGVPQGSQPGKQALAPSAASQGSQQPPFPFPSQPTEQFSSHLSQPSGPPQTFLGFQVVQSKAAASLRASLPCAQSCLGL